MRRWTPLTRKAASCSVAGRCIDRSRHPLCAHLSTSPPCRRRTPSNARRPRTDGSTIGTADGPVIRFAVTNERKFQSTTDAIGSATDKVEDSLQQAPGAQGDAPPPTDSESSNSQRSMWKKYKTEIKHTMTLDEKLLNNAQKTLRKELIAALDSNKAYSFIYNSFMNRWLKANGHDLQDALKKVADMRYPAEWYIEARATQRDVHLHIGPTNSGKTYNALKRLEEAESGFYAGPLRLLAHEVYSRFEAKGIPCDLITGDDVRSSSVEAAEANKYAATVEMVNTTSKIQVAVIDEIQMLADADRGWAWTRAFLGAVAKEVHLCGENRVLPLIQELTASMGDNLIVHKYERLNPLKCMRNSLEGNLSRLQKGDAIVVFSILGIHAMKKSIESKTGKRVAIVYGSLPPETRAQQAALFNDPDNDYDYLVASDAIGMGLNLSIKRVIFESVWKFDGQNRVQLSIPQIKQISGRAGRYRTAKQATDGDDKLDLKARQNQSVGLVTTLLAEDLPIVRAALEAEAPPITTAGVLPPGDFLEDLAARLPADTPHEYLLSTVAEAAAVHPRYAMCRIKEQLGKARIIESIKGLTTAERHLFTNVPFGFRNDNMQKGIDFLKEMATCVATNTQTTVADLKHLPLELLQQKMRPSREYLESMEFLHQCLILYMWLSYRLPNIYRAQPMAEHAKHMTENSINTYLERYSSADAQKKRALAREKATRDPYALGFGGGGGDGGLDSEGSRRVELGANPKGNPKLGFMYRAIQRIVRESQREDGLKQPSSLGAEPPPPRKEEVDVRTV